MTCCALTFCLIKIKVGNESVSSFIFCDEGGNGTSFGVDSVSFIDFEYAGLNFQAYDLANHFNEFAGMSRSFSIHLFFEFSM
jgi:thiamine kinase-like enzyme